MKNQNEKAYTLAEVMMVTLVLATMVAMSFAYGSVSQGLWVTSDIKIQLQENLRTTLQKVAVELRQTQTAQQNISNGTGPNSSDSIRFSIPVVCQSGGTFLDTNGNIAHWGAPLTWGCSSYTCMDADNNCLTVEYKYIQYHLNNSNQLVRDVLDGLLVLKRSNVIANNIIDFQAVLNGSVVSLTVQARKMAPNRRTLTAQVSEDVYLRN